MLNVSRNVPLSSLTRFGLGGPADMLIDASDEEAFIQALRDLRSSGTRFEVLGGGSNLVVSDEGFPGVILRYTAANIAVEGVAVTVDSGAVLQHLVDFTIDHGLFGIHTMTGIPGWVGGAIYGNAGAYGRSIDQSVDSVRFFDGQQIRVFGNAECRFRYRESTFKDHKGWIVFSTLLRLSEGDAAALRTEADGILKIRNAKYPPDMKCAGSIFKNLIFAELPAEVQAQVPSGKVLGGKVPSAWFLEQVNAKGLCDGDILVAEYHANLIYNAGRGTARQVREIAQELKRRVLERFGITLEEEVQYVGFDLAAGTGIGTA